MRLDIAAGTAVRFEPGHRVRAAKRSYLDGREARSKVSAARTHLPGRPSTKGRARISRAAYVHIFGRNRGRQVRLAEHRSLHRGERDHRSMARSEVRRRKVIRDRPGQSQRTRAQRRGRHRDHQCAIVDHGASSKADIGLKTRIVGIGKAWQPRHPAQVDIIIGPGTEAYAGEGKIVTAGGIDATSISSAAADRRCALQVRHHT